MKKESIFTGAATAIVTPMNAHGIDYEAFERMLNWQIAQGIDALVICGTTGEGSTLSDEEHREVLQFAINVVAGRVPMIAGTGSNDAAYAIDLTKFACDIGYDAMLLVTPYYNKTTQRGLVTFFTAIADASTKPVILYNVPSRTGVNIEPATYAKLASHPMIAASRKPAVTSPRSWKPLPWSAISWTSTPVMTIRSFPFWLAAARVSFLFCPMLYRLKPL